MCSARQAGTEATGPGQVLLVAYHQKSQVTPAAVAAGVAITRGLPVQVRGLTGIDFFWLKGNLRSSDNTPHRGGGEGSWTRPPWTR